MEKHISLKGERHTLWGSRAVTQIIIVSIKTEVQATLSTGDWVVSPPGGKSRQVCEEIAALGCGSRRSYMFVKAVSKACRQTKLLIY